MNDQKRKAKAIKEESNAVDACLKDLLASRQGRLLIWWLLDISNHGQQPFTANALSTAFNCGVFNVGQQIIARILGVDAPGYIRLLQERAEVEIETPGGYDYTDPRDEENE